MILIFSLVLILILSIIGFLIGVRDERYFGRWVICLITGFLSFITSFAFSMEMFERRYCDRQNLMAMKVVEETIRVAREGGEKLENAAMQQNIIYWNTWLAQRKYTRQSFWKDWAAPEIDTAEMIK